jgi:hypothetical protein
MTGGYQHGPDFAIRRELSRMSNKEREDDCTQQTEVGLAAEAELHLT